MSRRRKRDRSPLRALKTVSRSSLRVFCVDAIIHYDAFISRVFAVALSGVSVSVCAGDTIARRSRSCTSSSSRRVADVLVACRSQPSAKWSTRFLCCQLVQPIEPSVGAIHSGTECEIAHADLRSAVLHREKQYKIAQACSLPHSWLMFVITVHCRRKQRATCGCSSTWYNCDRCCCWRERTIIVPVVCPSCGPTTVDCRVRAARLHRQRTC